VTEEYNRPKKPKQFLVPLNDPTPYRQSTWNLEYRNTPDRPTPSFPLASLATIVAGNGTVIVVPIATIVTTTLYIHQRRDKGDHNQPKSKHLPIDSLSSSQMWASSFADLAKKASELQEQASAAVAATSMPVSPCATARIVSGDLLPSFVALSLSHTHCMVCREITMVDC
jgi:hypothetical protein